MPIVTLTDITVRSLRPTPGKQVTYLDKGLKGFGVRVSEAGGMELRPHCWCGSTADQDRRCRHRRAEGRTKAKTILAEKQLGIAKPEQAPTFDEAKALFLAICEQKNKPRTVRD